MGGTRIVVAADGSPDGLAAVRWAATEAWLRDTELTVLACAARTAGARLAAAGRRGGGRPSATAVLDAALDEVRAIAPHAVVHGEEVCGHLAPALLAAAGDAAVVVAGAAELGFGSTGALIATHGPGPAVVVRGRGNTATGPVVVGVDGSPAGDVAFELAVHEAALRRDRLLAVTAYQVPVPPMVVALPPPVVDAQALRDSAYRGLVRRRDAWRARYPDLPMDLAVVQGRPARVLTDLARTAQLVVVGSRRHGAVEGLLLGSVGRHLVRHADCPVLVARPA